MKFKILVNGHLTQRAADVLGAIGVLILFATAYFFEEWSGFWFWLFALVGGALGYVGAYGGLAKKFGLEAPFTNDPLGWREAKKSYKAESEDPNEASSDKNGL